MVSKFDDFLLDPGMQTPLLFKFFTVRDMILQFRKSNNQSSDQDEQKGSKHQYI